MRVTIYWRTKDGGLIDRIRKRFGADLRELQLTERPWRRLTSRQMDELREYERQGFIQLRNKP